MGLFGSIFGGVKSVIGAVGPIATSFIPGPAGTLARGVIGKITGSGRPPTTSSIIDTFSGGRGGAERVPADIRNVFEARARMTEASPQPQATNGVSPCPSRIPTGGNTRVNAAGQVAPPGWHWNVSSYTRRGGACSTKPAGFVERGTELVRNRRKFNTNNGPAERRAVARLKAGEKGAKDTLRALGYRTVSKRSAREMRNAGKKVCQ